MAANEYYQAFNPAAHHDPTSPTSHTSQGAYDPYNSHQAPSTSHLPQQSYTSYNPHGTSTDSPYHSTPQSPQGDFTYRPYESTTHSTSSPYNASGALAGGREHDRTSYADDVPLRPQGKTHTDNAFPDHYGDDPAVVDRVPERKTKKSFLARIPWVVYTLTLVQVSVFIAELAKNGKQLAIHLYYPC